MATYNYAWAVGYNVPLLSLDNLETLLYPYTQPRTLAPTSQPLELFPVRVTTLDGAERGEGMVSTTWVFGALPLDAYLFLMDTYFKLVTVPVVSRAVTIYTRNERFGYSRYNAQALRPQLGEQYTFRRQRVFDLQIRFNFMVAL